MIRAVIVIQRAMSVQRWGWWVQCEADKTEQCCLHATVRQARHRRIKQALGLQGARNSDINLFQQHADVHFIFANAASVQLQLQGVAEVIVPIVLHLSRGPKRGAGHVGRPGLPGTASGAERGVGSRSDSYASVSWPSVPRFRIQPGLPSPRDRRRRHSRHVSR